MSKPLTLELDGEKLVLEVPSDLDARLLALSGISAAEMHRQLCGNCIAGTLAKALAPLVPGLAVKRHELASLIAKEGPSDVRHELRSIYGKALGISLKRRPAGKHKPAQPPSELTVEAYCDVYMRGEGRDDAEMLQFAANNGEAIEAEFQRRNEAAQAQGTTEAGDDEA
jgi:hypothetical protein